MGLDRWRWVSTVVLLNPNSNPNFTLIVKVLTFNRLESVARCLRSLAAADYLTDNKVQLHVYIDHFALGDASSNVGQKLKESHRILEFLDGFEWKYGDKLIHYRTANAGLRAQWLEAWWPSSDNEFAFVVEDDLEVSPLYYKFLRSLIVNYYYNASNYRPYIYGASLQRPRFVPDQFLKSVGAYKLMSFQDSYVEMIKEVLVKVYVLKKCLESRYNTWVVDGNMLPVNGDLFIEADPSYDFYIGKSSDLFFAGRSSSARNIGGNDFKSKFAMMVNSLLAKRQSLSFGYIVAKFLVQKGVKVKGLDETRLGFRIGNGNVNQSLGDGKRMVFWSSDMASDLFQKQLQEFGIWIVNDDFSCKAVVCHKS
ncbi:hypothetical protein ACE6H2_020731 [Prunus campanulata]